MRTLLAGERATSQGARVNHYLKLEVRNASGTWKDVSALLSRDYVVGGGWGAQRDQMVGTAQFRIRRRQGTDSLSPLIVASLLNRDDGGSYAPLLDIGAAWRVSTATVIPGAITALSDFRPGMQGVIDEVAWESDPIVIQGSDDGAWLMDTQIEAEREYGSTAGVALEDVLQQLLDENPTGGAGVTTPTLYTPVSPSFAVKRYRQDRVKLGEALRSVALSLTGWDVRYRYDASHVFRLTLMDPDRDRTTVDATFGPTEYTDVRRLNLSRATIRNAGAMSYTDATGAVKRVTQQDDASISKYRRRYFELPQADGIDTAAEAQQVIDAAVHDLAGPPAEQVVECPFVWFVQLFDRFTFLANGEHYDQDQTFAVTGYWHEFADGSGQGVTTITTADRVIGAYESWEERIIAPTTDVCELRNVQKTETPTDVTWTFTLGPGVAEVWAANGVVTAPEVSGDWDAVAAAVLPLPTGTLSYTVPRPLDGQVTLVQLEPRRADLSVGTFRRLLVTGAPQPPVHQSDDAESGTVGTQWLKLMERGIAVTQRRGADAGRDEPRQRVGPAHAGTGRRLDGAWWHAGGAGVRARCRPRPEPQ
jgi:hypothetical protein